MLTGRRRRGRGGGGGDDGVVGRRRLLGLGRPLLLLALLYVLLATLPAARAHEHHHEHEHAHHHAHAHHGHEQANPAAAAAAAAKVAGAAAKAAAAAAAAADAGAGGWLASPWARAFAATTLISVVPTLVLPFIPLASTGADGAVALNEKLHRTLLAFAAGGLLGEVFLHSLPHLLEGLEAEEEKHDHHGHQGHGHAHGHGHGAAERVSLWVLAGFLLFFASEKAVKVVLGEGGHGHSHAGHGHVHHHHHSGHKKAKLEEEEWEDEEGSSAEDDGSGSGSVDGQGLRRRSRRIRERDGQRKSPPGGAGSSPRKHGASASSSSSSSSKGRAQRQPGQGRGDQQALVGEGGLKASGYLNIVVDLLHNLTDGIAIGASFASQGVSKGGGGTVGLATTLSVFLHEIPHEIGDFAILVQSGLSLRAAFLMQFCTAIAAYVGTAAGLAATRHEGLERVLVGLMSGGFLYVGAVSVLPELLAGKAAPWQAVREVAGVVGGIGLMMLVGHGEEGH